MYLGDDWLAIKVAQFPCEVTLKDRSGLSEYTLMDLIIFLTLAENHSI